MGTRGKSRNLAWNLLVWSTFNYLNTSNSAGIFQFSSLGNPSVIFNRNLLLATMSSGLGYCSAATVVDFTAGNYKLTFPNYMNNQICGGTINPAFLLPQSLSKEPPDDLILYFDMQSFTIAAAINSGILSLDALVGVPSELSFDDDDDGNTYYSPTSNDDTANDDPNSWGGPVGPPFPIATGEMINTDYAQQNYVQGCVYACNITKLTFTTCNGDIMVDTYMRLFKNSTNTEVAFNDDFCGSSSQITYKVVDGCDYYCLHIGCYGDFACTTVVDAYSSAITSSTPTINPTISPTIIENNSPTNLPTTLPTTPPSDTPYVPFVNHRNLNSNYSNNKLDILTDATKINIYVKNILMKLLHDKEKEKKEKLQKELLNNKLNDIKYKYNLNDKFNYNYFYDNNEYNIGHNYNININENEINNENKKKEKEKLTLSKVNYAIHGRRTTQPYGFLDNGYFKAYYSPNFLGMDPIYW